MRLFGDLAEKLLAAACGFLAAPGADQAHVLGVTVGREFGLGLLFGHDSG